MIKRPSSVYRLTILLVLSVPFFKSHLHAQSIDRYFDQSLVRPFNNYYYDYRLLNPAYIGTLGRHAITTHYGGEPDFEGLISNFAVAYEVSVKGGQHGLGVQYLRNRIGASRFHQPSLLYTHRLKFSEDSGMRVGVQMNYQIEAIYWREFDLQTDPLLDSDGVSTSTRFNADLGLQYFLRNLEAGIAVKNILHQDFGRTNMNMIVSYRFKPHAFVQITPSVVYQTNFSRNTANVNSTFLIRKWILLGAGYWYHISQRTDDFTLNAGLNIKEWGQFVVHLNSTAANRLREYTSPYLEVMLRTTVPHKTTK